jgi:hypothetical protein
MVTSITVEEYPQEGTDYRSQLRRVHFNVQESMRGDPSTEIEVLTGMGGGDCGFGFLVGQSYLVYANRGDGRLRTSICSGTRLLGKAEEDINYIHSLATAPPGASIFGTIMRLREPPESNQVQEPLAGITVPVKAEDGTSFTAVTNADGKFSLAGLKPGKYSIKPEFPDSLIARDIRGERSVIVADRGCAREDFYAIVNGRISGRVVNADGTPATTVPLILDSVAGWQTNPLMTYLHTQTDADGHFEFNGLRPGEYVFGVTLLNPPDELDPYPKTFYPGVENFDTASRLRIGEAEGIQNVDFRLPPRLTATRLTVAVIGRDGKSEIGAGVVVSDKEFNGPPWVGQTDSQGRCEVSVFEGRTYSVSASKLTPRDQQDCMQQVELTVEHNPKAVRMQVDCEGKKK